MNRLANCLLVLLLFTGIATAQKRAVPLTGEPWHHLVQQNDKTRAFFVEVPARARTEVHQHDHDYLWVSIGDGQVSNVLDGKSPQTVQTTDGQVQFSAAPFAHLVKNLGSTPFRNVTVEILKKPDSNPPKDTEAIAKGKGWEAVASFEDDRFRVTKMTLQPAATISAKNPKYSHLMVAVSALDMRYTIETSSEEIKKAPGETKWVVANGTYSLTNTGTTPARFVTIEFK